MLTDDLAKVIEEHRIEWDQGTGYDGCACSWRPKYPPVVAFEDHAAHVAEALESIVSRREREAARKAWDEGWNECVDHRTCTFQGPGECPDTPPNPYGDGDNNE